MHSTGQLHKGGTNTGVFLLLTADAPHDVAIPDIPHSLGTLQRAQAIGDFRSLQARGRRVIRLHLEQDIARGLDILIRAGNAKSETFKRYCVFYETRSPVAWRSSQ